MDTRLPPRLAPQHSPSRPTAPTQDVLPGALRRKPTLHKRWLVILGLSTLLTTSALAETYIIRINASQTPISYRVTGVYPLQTVPCASCTGASAPVRTIEPGAAVPLFPGGPLPGLRMIAGAFAIETSAPLAIQLVAYRGGLPERRQHLDVGRRWIPPGRHTISAVERVSGTGWRMNLFVVNPRETPVTVSAWVGQRDENERRQTVAPLSTAVMAVGPPLCNGVGCPFPTDFPPSPIRVEVETDGEVLTSVSSLAGDWAVFSLADQARD
jgi:hypothetical protein